MALPRLSPEIRPALPGDYRSGRQNTPVDTLVLHTTEGGSIAGAASWWDREDVTASAHYLLDGARIVQRVAEGDTAFHAGNPVMNRRSIGIEVVGRHDRISTWTPAVMEQLIDLAADICERHGIPVLHQAGPGICGHADVPDPYHPTLRGGAGHHQDPGSHLDWMALLDGVRARIAGARPLDPAPVPQARPVGPDQEVA